MGASGNQYVEIAVEGVLQCGLPVEPVHYGIGVGALFYIQRYFQPVQVGFITNICNVLYFVTSNKSYDGIYNRFSRCRIWYFVNFYTAVFLVIFVFCPYFEAAFASFIDFSHVLLVENKGAACRKIRTFDILQQIHIFILYICNRSVAHFLEVEAAKIAGHTDGNALVRIHENAGESRRQQGWFLHRSVVIVHKINGVFLQVPEQFFTDFFQLNLCVTRGGELHVSGILAAHVAFGIYVCVEQCPIAPGQPDQCLVDGHVTVRIQLHGLPHDIRRLCAVACQEPHFVHGVQQLPV